MFKILFREDKHTHDEFAECSSKINTIRFRHQIEKDDLILGRYSVLPFYKELQDECEFVGAKMVNSYQQHEYIADMKDWVLDLEGMTPRTWMLSDLHGGYMSVPDTEHGYFIKGATNSKKHLWATHARAKTKADIGAIVRNLQDDMFLEGQDIAIREFVPLKILEEGVGGLPMAHEYRFFYLNGNLVSSGFYWSIIDKLPKFEYTTIEGFSLAHRAAQILKHKVPACVIDVAEKADGGWIVVEVNDFQMSGLSTIEAGDFYKNLARVAKECNYV